MVPPPEPKLISFGALIPAGYRVIVESGRAFGGFLVAFGLLIVAILVGAFILVSLAEQFQESGDGALLALLGVALLAYVGVFLYMFAASFAIFHAILTRRDNGGYWQSFGWAFKHLIAIGLIVFYMQVITHAGYFLFIIPGIIATIYLEYALYVLVDRDRRGAQALIDSFELVHGRFFAVLARKALLYVLMLLAFAGAFMSFLFGAVVHPLVFVLSIALTVGGILIMYGGSIALYESLRTLPPRHTFSDEERTTIAWWLRAFLIAAIVFALFGFYSAGTSQWEVNFSEEVQGLFEGIERRDDPNAAIEDAFVALTVAEKNERERVIISEISTARAEAEVYRTANLESYAGVCSADGGINDALVRAFDAGATNVHCSDAREGYLAEVELLGSGVYYCIDSTGFARRITGSRAGETACQSELPSGGGALPENPE